MIYIDTSALVKAIVREEGTGAVRALIEKGEPLVSSRLAAVELSAAAQRRSLPDVAVAGVLDRVSLVSVDDETLDAAIALRSGLRTLDALHLATAVLLEDAVTSFLAFDVELNAAAERHGLTRWALS